MKKINFKTFFCSQIFSELVIFVERQQAERLSAHPVKT